MSKQTKKFFEQLKAGGEASLVENIKEAASALKEIGGQIWDGMKPAFDHGRSEAAALLFTGQSHVMYMKNPEINQLDREPEQTKEATEHQRDEEREM